MKKKAIFGTVAATTLPLALFMLSILNYDSIDFYQSDLDATRAKLNNIEKVLIPKWISVWIVQKK